MITEYAGLPCKLICPKCRGNSITFSETWVGNGIWFTVRDGVMPSEADDHYAGGPARLDAECLKPQCKHRWRVRGVTSFDQLAVDPPDESEKQG